MHGSDDEPGDSEEVWACLTRSDLDADLRECDEAVADAGNSASRSAEDLRGTLTGEAFAGEAIDTEVFISRHTADQELSTGLQQLYAEVEMLQFNVASMVALLTQGPLRAPEPQPAPSGAARAFGVEAQAALAALPTLSLPASAASLADYQERLKSLPPCLALPRDLRLSSRRLDPRQDEKDINRDRLEVNGVEVRGAEGGYNAAVATIAEALQADSPDLPADAARRAAQLLLGALNRTTSGFIAFEEVLRLYDCPDVVVVSPESAAARPLEAAITGGVVLGRAHTRYAVHRTDGEGRVASVDVYVAFRCSGQSLQKEELEVPARVLMYRSATAGDSPVK